MNNNDFIRQLVTRLSTVKHAIKFYNKRIEKLMELLDSLEQEKKLLDQLVVLKNVSEKRLENAPLAQYEDIEKFGALLESTEEEMLKEIEASISTEDKIIKSNIVYKGKTFAKQDRIMFKGSKRLDGKATAELMASILKSNGPLPKDVLVEILQLTPVEFNNIQRYTKDKIERIKEGGRKNPTYKYIGDDLFIPKVVNMRR